MQNIEIEIPRNIYTNEMSWMPTMIEFVRYGFDSKITMFKKSIVYNLNN